MATSTTIQIHGPLYRNPFENFRTYQSIVSDVRKACSLEPSLIVLAIDSPGGVFSGCIEAAQEIRQLAQDAGKSLRAQISGEGCSAAYALACAADFITAEPSAAVGSIGVLEMLRSIAEHERQLGIATEIVATGARKADGSPYVPLSPEALAERKRLVEGMGSLLFNFVAERRKISVEQVRALEGRCLLAQQAMEARLIDAVLDGAERAAQEARQRKAEAPRKTQPTKAPTLVVVEGEKRAARQIVPEVLALIQKELEIPIDGGFACRERTALLRRILNGE